jgi:tetratricopeptide (TPR) repeat protein
LDKAKLFSQAEKCLAKGQYEKALEAFELILRSDPNDSKALSRAADLYLKRENFEKGFDALRRLAEAFTREGFFSRAVAIYKRMLKIEQISSREALIQIHEKLADLYGQLSLISDAMSHFSIVVDHYDRAMNHDALLNVLRKVSDLDPYNIDSQLKLAELFYSQQRNLEAVQALDKLAENIKSRGHLPDVIRVYERWVELDTKDHKALGNLVHHYLAVNEPKKALARIQVAFRADPRNVDVLDLLSETFLSLKQPEKSKAVDLELIKLSRAVGDQGKLDRAERRLKGIANPPPGVSSVSDDSSGVELREEAPASKDLSLPESELTHDERRLMSEADVYLKYGLLDKAHDLLKKSLETQSKSLVLRWKLKQLALEKEDTETAAHLLNEIVMLARSSGKSDIERLASDELRVLDPKSLADEQTVKKDSTATSVESIELNEFDSSDISIVLDEQDISAVTPKADEMANELILEDSMSGPVVDLGSDSLPLEMNHQSDIELISENSVESIDLSGEVSVTDDEPVALLTESDFSPEELSRLSSQLDPDGSMDLEMAALAPVPTPPAARSEPVVEVDADFELRQSLEEVEFFKSQGLDAEAKALLKSLSEKFPGHALLGKFSASAKAATEMAEALKSKTTELEALGRKVRLNVQEDTRDAQMGEFFDLGAELDAELSNEKVEEGFGSPTNVRDVFNAFKQGVAQSVSEEDWQTHFDLGVAYREMELLDDAIQAFELVGRHPAQRASALYQIGLCELAKGQLQSAKKRFDEALNLPNVMAQEKISITYELAEVLLRLNKKDEATKLFKEVQKVDPEFREVTEKVKALGSKG